MGCPTCGQKFRRTPPAPLAGNQAVVPTVNPNRRVAVNGVIKQPVQQITPPKPVLPPQS